MKRLLLLNILIVLVSFSMRAQFPDKFSGQHIVIETSMGNIELLLYDDTPLHRDNMIKLINDGFYKDLLFHRVINNFMIQGGDPHSLNAAKGQRLGSGGPGYKVPAEFRSNHFHKKGALAAARMGDSANPKKESSGSQFYIVKGQVFTPEQLASLQADRHLRPFTPEQIEIYTSVGGTPHLDGDYTVFGEITKGLDVLDAISAVSTDNSSRPIEDIIFSIKLK